jgi:hypothetical protein
LFTKASIGFAKVDRPHLAAREDFEGLHEVARPEHIHSEMVERAEWKNTQNDVALCDDAGDAADRSISSSNHDRIGALVDSLGSDGSGIRASSAGDPQVIPAAELAMNRKHHIRTPPPMNDA